MDLAAQREDMVDGLEHEAKGCVVSEAVSLAMRAVPREAFLPEDARAYADRSFDHLGTRVFAPRTAARLLEALAVTPEDSVLVVGVGVGYTAALAAELADPTAVQAVDIDRRLVGAARSNLAAAGYRDVLVDCRSGSDGLPAYAPYDRILLEAAAVGPPRPLLDQLAPDGRLVMPLGTHDPALVAVGPEGRVHDRYGPIRVRPMLVDGERADTVEANRTHRENREFAARRRPPGWERDWIDWDAREAGRDRSTTHRSGNSRESLD
ncbi:protein-L-isoaspartate O-methyltransferase family protein [Halococcoides cellulosivorans]|uniref:protein-L-isoaspartate(D-aspartate) O-methyltransferase n=1 Tax=Halococcoides cellulosivorans TaxID=1679096 RepID=A0A2R4X432_9EURY|nr:methyltransferase [Halococcoides cellulosivorans]AWB28548.1 protein-L-isoaspartate O-methyltransferase [Halococcoides cellulosivorans]